MGVVVTSLASFFILAGWVLLLVATISSPVVNRISFLDITTDGVRSTFGVFGYCANQAAGVCTNSRLGYSISQIAAQQAGLGSSGYYNASADNATRGLILHPIAAGIAFIAWLIALGSTRIGYLFASLIVFLSFIVSLAAMVLDFALFGIVRNAINNRSTNVTSVFTSSEGSASFSTAIWLVLAATISLLIATLFTLFACCCGGDRHERRHRSNVVTPAYAEGAYVGNQPQMVQTGYAPRRAAWWNVRNRA